MSKVLASFAGIKKGQKFKVIKNVGSHNYPMNKTLVFRVDGTAASSMNNIAKGTGDYNNIRIDEIEIFNETLIEMRERRDQLSSSKNAEIAELDEKIKACEELNLEVYDELFVTIHKCLVVLGANATLVEKTTAIISIIKPE